MTVLLQQIADAKAEGWAEWIRSESDERAVREGHRFDIAAAERVRAFFSKFLRQSKGEWAGKLFELQDWQWRDVIAPLFGWIRPNGTRRFRHAYIEVPKKNGKSTLCSGLSLYMLLADREPGAEVYAAAANRDQSSIVYNEAANMVESSPHLASRLTVIRSTKRIVDYQSKSFFKALSADVSTKDGFNSHAVIIDELHAQKTRDLWDVLRYAGAARRQPLNISITTAGYDKHSICWEQHEYAKGVIEGTVTALEFFGYIAAADEKDDWTKEETWKKANPSYGITLGADQFREDCREAQEMPSKENSFRRLRLNQWTEQDERWLSMDHWEKKCTDELPNLEGQACFAGLDLSTTTDITALALVFRLQQNDSDKEFDESNNEKKQDNDKYAVLPFFWVPEEGARRRERRDKVPYSQWIREGYIEATPGDVVDYEYIRRKINELYEVYSIQAIYIDRWNATQLAVQLAGDGFEIKPFGQGYASMNAPSKKLQDLVVTGMLIHGNNPVLRWMAGNVAKEEDPAGNIKPSKSKSTERIDGIVAMIMGIAGATTEEAKNWYYLRHGVEIG